MGININSKKDFNCERSESIQWVRGVGQYTDDHGWGTYEVDKHPATEITFIVTEDATGQCAWYDHEAKVIAFHSLEVMTYWFLIWGLNATMEANAFTEPRKEANQCQR